MKILIRADSSSEIGTGHVVRCLTLADELRARGATVSFACKPLRMSIIPEIEREGYQTVLLDASLGESAEIGELTRRVGAAPPDWIIVDHYRLGEQWEAQARRITKGLLAIDDMDRAHDCDMLLDQNLSLRPDRYSALRGARRTLLLGPNYALLRPQFKEARSGLKRAPGPPQRFLIMFGGSDRENYTALALRALQRLARPGWTVDVVAGAANPNQERLRELCQTLPFARFHSQVEDIAALMTQADLSIGAAGVATWERCCLGLPALVVILEENQRLVAEAVASFGAIVNLGWARELRIETFITAVSGLAARRLAEMSSKGMELVDGFGASRVAQAILERRLSYA